VRVAGVDAPTYVHTGIHSSHDKGGIYVREQEYRAEHPRVSSFQHPTSLP
jgi:hypothetical protein